MHKSSSVQLIDPIVTKKTINIEFTLKRVPSLASKYFRMNVSPRCHDHFTPKLINSIENLMEVLANIYGPSKCFVNNPKHLISL